jgi:hypothetical protein
MLARRVIALSPDKAFAKQIGTALRAAGGAVEVHQTLDGLGKGELQASLVVVHVDGDLAGAVEQLYPRLAGDGRLIAILPKPDLVRTIAIMGLSERIAGVLNAEHFKASDLTSMATRLLAGDIFGLEKLVPWGTKIYSQLVGDYQEKSLCIAQVSEFAELMGVRRKYREAVEQVVDEMLMNALYDAPVDDQGKQIFADIPTKTRISLRMEQKVVVQYACDDKTFSVSVRDSFGTLDRATVVRYIDKCLHSEQQIDRKTGGAGLGLYLMANSTTRMFFNVLPGVATEAVCSFDLDQPKVQLQKLAFFNERIDAAGRLAAGPSRLLPAGVSHPVERRQGTRGDRREEPAARSSGAVVLALSTAILLLLVLIGLVAYPRLRPPPTGGLEVVTSPGATVEVDGKVRGVADEEGRLTIDGLEAGRSYAVTASLEGHVASRALAAVEDGREAQVELPLAAENSRVMIDSDPSGATVVIEGGEAIGTTPLVTTRFAPGSKVRLVLSRRGFADEIVDLTTPGPGGEAQVTRELDVSPEVASIIVTSDPPGAEIAIDGQKQVAVTTPTAEILVAAGKPHTVTFELEGYLPVTVKITPGRGARELPVTAKLVRAISIKVTSNLDARVTIDKVEGCERKATPATCAVTPGSYELKLETTKVAGKVVRPVKAVDKDLTVDIDLGIVEAPEDAQLLVNRKEVSKVALEVGKRVVTVILADGTMLKTEVRVDAKRAVKVKIPD